jgi:hypothetical protein
MNEERDIDYFELGRLIHICRSRPIQILDDFEDDEQYLSTLNICFPETYEKLEADLLIEAIIDKAFFPNGKWSL